MTTHSGGDTQAPFTQALIDLGYRDGLKERPQLEAFFR